MTQIPQERSVVGTEHDISRVKRPISERKLQANRANAKRSTGPRTEAGKAASRRNALKHGILSLSSELPPVTPGLDLHSVKSVKKDRSLVSESLLTDSASQDINRIWERMARVLVFERDCMQRTGGLEENWRLIHRYERMLSRQLHERICQQGTFPVKNRKTIGRS
jgi:hypothetical protein